MPPQLPAPVFDTMLGVPPMRDGWHAAFGSLVRDAASRRLRQPAGFLFQDLPEVDADLDYPTFLVGELDHWGVAGGLVPVTFRPDDPGVEVVARHPDRFLASFAVDPNEGTAAVRALRQAVATHDVRAATCFPAGTEPQVALDAALMYPLYAACVELGIPMFVNAGVPGPRMPLATQHVARLDRVCAEFPELVLVTRHGGEPWEDLLCEFLDRWPGLHYSTSAFAPRHYPRAVVDYANHRNADKILYGGYFPYGLSLERLVTELAHVPLAPHAWAPFLHGNAERLLGVPRQRDTPLPA